MPGAGIGNPLGARGRKRSFIKNWRNAMRDWQLRWRCRPARVPSRAPSPRRCRRRHPMRRISGAAPAIWLRSDAFRLEAWRRSSHQRVQCDRRNARGPCSKKDQNCNIELAGPRDASVGPGPRIRDVSESARPTRLNSAVVAAPSSARPGSVANSLTRGSRPGVRGRRSGIIELVGLARHRRGAGRWPMMTLP